MYIKQHDSYVRDQPTAVKPLRNAAEWLAGKKIVALKWSPDDVLQRGIQEAAKRINRYEHIVT